MQFRSRYINLRPQHSQPRCQWQTIMPRFSWFKTRNDILGIKDLIWNIINYKSEKLKSHFLFPHFPKLFYFQVSSQNLISCKLQKYFVWYQSWLANLGPDVMRRGLIIQGSVTKPQLFKLFVSVSFSIFSKNLGTSPLQNWLLSLVWRRGWVAEGGRGWFLV